MVPTGRAYMEWMDNALVVFENDPTDGQLALILGPDFAASGVSYKEDATAAVLGPRRFPFKRVAVFIVAFFGPLTVLPWILPALGVRFPSLLARREIVLLTAALWAVIVPTFLGLMFFFDRAARTIGPGAVLNRAERTLSLPHAGRTIALETIDRFVELVGRRIYGGEVSHIVQYGVTFGEGDGDCIAYAPIAKLTGPEPGASSLVRLAKACGTTVRRVRPKALIRAPRYSSGSS